VLHTSCELLGCSLDSDRCFGMAAEFSLTVKQLTFLKVNKDYRSRVELVFDPLRGVDDANP
jgi:hypothetical protein